ncbi:MAG TPA: 5'-3' exonuclease H3TH domain-containing protein [candidate division Zixibacteria bacterium]|nr:5'-3' exonuclease H3TH domain-containing protein [candidate division Zixibacteria bacterium]
MTGKNRGSLYLIDGSAIVYRSYFAFIRNPLINSKGENTSATFGFINSLLKIINDEKPDYLAIVFDTPKPTFRHEQYKEYKSTRAKMPEDLVVQLPRIRQAAEALNIPVYELEGYEADDVIGTIATRAASDGFDVWCVTGDKDYFQLVKDNLRIYYPKSGSSDADKMGREEVKAKFGVYPEQVIDKLALMGDNSDNVPGIPGIGPKTADSLLEQFGTLEKVLEGHDQIKAKGVREKVSSNKDSAIMSRELVTILTTTPIDYELDDLKRRDVNYEAAKKLFLELEFSRLLKQVMPDAEIEELEPAKAQAAKADYHLVSSLKELKDLVSSCLEVKEVAIDTETTSLNTLEAELVGVSVAMKAGAAYYIPLGHSEDKENNLPFDEALKEIKRLTETKKVQKFGQNIKYDLEVFHRYDVDIDPIGFDTMLASYVLDPSARENSLDFLAMKHFDYKMQPISDLIGSGKNQKSFATVPVKKATFYAAEDAD